MKNPEMIVKFYPGTPSSHWRGTGTERIGGGGKGGISPPPLDVFGAAKSPKKGGNEGEIGKI